MLDQPHPAAAAQPIAHNGAGQPTLHFIITATQADGSSTHWTQQGGTSMDHVLSALDIAGPGGAVRVQRLRPVAQTLGLTAQGAA